MAADDSVSAWLDRLQAGDPSAAHRLWQRYFPRLVGLARQKLRDAPRRVADEEDVALSAFGSFCRAAEAGRFPDLLDRDGLWRLLVVITARKAAHLLRDQGRQKRGGRGGPRMPRRRAPRGRSAWTRSSAGSPAPSSPPRRPRSSGACWACWATRSWRR